MPPRQHQKKPHPCSSAPLRSSDRPDLGEKFPHPLGENFPYPGGTIPPPPPHSANQTQRTGVYSAALVTPRARPGSFLSGLVGIVRIAPMGGEVGEKAHSPLVMGEECADD